MNSHFLQTERLLLRPYQDEDLEALHRLWTDPGVRRYLFDDQVVPRRQVLAEIEQSVASFKESGFGQWAVVPKGQAELVGFCGYRHFHDPPELQLIYGLAPEYWGRGLAVEASRAVVGYGFEMLDFDRVVASTDAPNLASVRVMEKIGMSFQKRVVLDGLDTIYYVVDRVQWAQTK